MSLTLYADGLCETDKAWMAGFVDGEGCITISRQVRKNRPSPAYRVAVSISNTRRKVLEIFLHHYGGAIYDVHERRREKRNVKWADAFDWHCPIASTERFLSDLLPYLRLKDEQARLCLRFLQERANTAQHRRPSGTFAGSEGLTAVELEWREQLRQQVQALNSKGRRARSGSGLP